jgi:hypothetical protein
MEEILSTISLEYDKSTFIIDVVKHSNEQLYIAIEQIIHLHLTDKDNQSQKIKINPSILDDIIETLINFQKQLPKQLSSKRYFSKERKEEVKKRYLKGISIKDLVLQFNCKENIIEQILRNSGIEIVSNEIPKATGRFKYKRRKKL